MRNIVNYGEKWKDEMMFPALFKDGVGGYNSSYHQPNVRDKKTMPTLQDFNKMFLFSIRRERANNALFIFS